MTQLTFGIARDFTTRTNLILLFEKLKGPDKRDQRLLVSSERHWQTGINEVAEVPGRQSWLKFLLPKLGKLAQECTVQLGCAVIVFNKILVSFHVK